MAVDTRKKLLFFSPHTGIWEHAFPEALLAESLMKSGHDIYYVTCGEVFKNHCEAMSAVQMGHDATLEKKSRVCAQCQFQGDLLRHNLQLPGCRLADVLSETDLTWAQANLSAAPDEGFDDYLVDGMPVGRCALYALLLHAKKTDLNLNDEERAIYRVELFNTLLSLAAAKKLVAQEKPDRVIVYNALHPVNHIFKQYVESLGIPCYALNASANLAHRLQFISLTRGVDVFAQQIEAWPRYRKISAGPVQMANAIDHFATTILGERRATLSISHEMAGDLRVRFGVPGGAKVLVATMSSYDERFAAETVGAIDDFAGRLIFDRQVDWIAAVIEYVADRPDLFFIVRVHPREFRGVISQHATALETLFNKLPTNVRINWPTDEISLFDLAEITDVFLNAWSTAGKEMGLLGMPVVLYSRHLVFYPADLNYVGDTSRADYFDQIERALSEGWRAERIVKTFRWYALEHHWSQFDLEESYPLPEDTLLGTKGRQRLMGVANAAEARLDVYHRTPRLRQADLLSAVMEQGADSLLAIVEPESFRTTTADQELKLARAQIGRLLSRWHGNGVPTSLSGLFVRLYSFANGN